MEDFRNPRIRKEEDAISHRMRIMTSENQSIKEMCAFADLPEAFAKEHGMIAAYDGMKVLF